MQNVAIKNIQVRPQMDLNLFEVNMKSLHKDWNTHSMSKITGGDYGITYEYI